MQNPYTPATTNNEGDFTKGLERLLLISRRIMQFEESEERLTKLRNRIRTVNIEIQMAITLYNTNNNL